MIDQTTCRECGGRGSESFWDTRNPSVVVRAKCKRCGGAGRLYTVQWLDGKADLPVIEPLAVAVMDEPKPRRMNYYQLESRLLMIPVAIVIVMFGVLFWYT